MYCTRCGVELDENVRYCSSCGTATAQAACVDAPARYPRLSRPYYDKKIAGVCSGFARYLGLDVTLVRVLWLVLIFFPVPVGLIAYVVAWIVMPRDPIALPATTAPQTVSADRPLTA
jgi:phage shock protein C